MSKTKNMQELSPEEVRETVAGHYAGAVKAATAPRTCCGPAAPVNLEEILTEEDSVSSARLKLLEQVEPGTLAKSNDYTEEQMAALPADAVNASFGCGNPVNLAGLKPGDTVIDLGSGAGIDVILSAQIVGPEGHVIGIDMTDDMIEKARANIAEAGLTNAEIRKGIIEDMPVESDSVDWMVSNCVINLSPEKPKVFAEAYRVLKPGGQFLVSDIVVGDIPDAIRENVLGYVSCVGGAVPEEEYLDIIRGAGFEDVEVVLRHVYGAKEMLAIVGYDDFPEGDAGDLARQVVNSIEGKIVSIKVRGRKTA